VLLFVGDDWAENHHDVEVMDASGRRLAKARLPEGVAGITRLHAMIGAQLGDDTEDVAAQVKIGIETDRGPWVQALIAAGYTVYAVNPLQAARYRERLAVSGAKSDLLTELWGGSVSSVRQLQVGAVTFPGHDRREGRRAGSVPVGGRAARVA
jgi:hypothetical protein